MSLCSHEAALLSMRQQLSELAKERARVESHRDEVSRQQGQYKGAIAKVRRCIMRCVQPLLLVL